MDQIEARTMAKVSRRLLPFLILCFMAAYLDRINVGIAALEMNKSLGFSATMYATGAGIFFLGYFFFEIPSNLMLHKYGARKWIARIMISWGVVSSLMAFVTDEKSFYILRFLLGVAEAGFFPGIIYYLTYWFPEKRRGKVFGLFLVATPVAIIIGSPISALLLNLEGWMGLHGWQNMFIIEGLPSVLLGFVVLKYLVDGPKDAKWLTEEERAWLLAEMARENKGREDGHSTTSVGKALRDKRVYLFGLAYVGIISGLYGIILWLPQIVKGFGLANNVVGFVTAIPYCAAAVGMIYWSRHSDKTGERPLHVAGACFLSALGLGLSAWITDPFLSMVVLVVAAVGVFSAMATFWAIPTAFLSGTGAAAGIAAINSIGNLGGFSGPYVVGYIKDATGSFSAGMLFLSACIFLCGVIVLMMDKRRASVAASAQALTAIKPKSTI